MIKLEETVNTRDLGDYKTICGRITECNVFIRSDNTHKVTENDIKKLTKEHSLKTVIDLRTEKEVEEFPDKFADIEGVNYINTPIYYDACLEGYMKGDESLFILYSYILKEKKHVLKNIFDLIANAEEGAVLFHCTLGRDRTAMVAMLLLGLAKVDKQDIIDDYSITYDLIKDLDIIKRDLILLGEQKVRTLPENIEKAMNFVEENYGSFENYLLSCGISQENLNKIRSKFVR